MKNFQGVDHAGIGVGNMDVWEYKRMCMRMAGAMGYTSLSIRKAFGIEYKKDLDTELTELYNTALSGSLAYG